MPEPLDAALDALRPLLLDPSRLVRAVAAGRRRGLQPPRWRRVEVRPVSLKAGSHLQISEYAAQRPTVRNVAAGPDAEAAVTALLAEPYGNWHVTTTDAVTQLRVTKRGEAQVHREAAEATTDDTHDRRKAYLLDPGDPLFDVIGGNAAKRRQVDAFLRVLDGALGDEPGGPLRVVDLGCGNAYLTFAAYRHLTNRGWAVDGVGVDVREDQRARNTELAAKLGYDGLRFTAGSIATARVDEAPEVVLALHACDTATDEALARAVTWGARHILAAPCCHHDIAAQLKAMPTPAPYGLLTRHGILRERFADVLTDALRAALLRLHGYRVDVVEFVGSQHTPRNTLLRARHGGAGDTAEARTAYTQLTETWGVTPRLAELLP